MNISELIEQLQDIASEHGDNIEVRLAQQPQWAFEYSMGQPVVVDLSDGDKDEAREMLRNDDLSDVERAEAQAVIDRDDENDAKIVNGAPVLEAGKHTGARPGAILYGRGQVQ